VYFALVAAGMGVLWWRHLRQHDRSQTRALGTVFDPDAEVALHVAGHEARSRGTSMTSLHVLYGLLQDEQIAGAIRDAGGEPATYEDRVLAMLTDGGAVREVEDDLERTIGRAAAHASHAERRATTTDLWAYLRGSAAAQILDEHVLATVLFRLCHGSEPSTATAGNADVHVVLRNDDYTTQQFVCHVLEDVFALDEATASAHMLQTHTQGRAVIGRYRPDDARAKIDAVRARAKEAGFPLWIGVEPI
jgi:ATP-dependent Clp protease adaptor protein ClpS